MDSRQVVIMPDFIQYRLGFFHRRHGDSADAYVHLTFAVGAFVVIHQAKVVVGAKAQLVFRFVQGLVARHEVLSRTQDVSEVERGPAKQGQVLEASVAAKIHHAHKVADARGVGRARRELIVDLIDVDNDAIQPVRRGMIVGQRLGLFPKDAWRQNQHVGLSDGMYILVGDALPMFHCEGGCRVKEHITSLHAFTDGKDHVVARHDDLLPHGVHGRRHIPQRKALISILNPNSACATTKLAHHQPEREHQALASQLTPAIELHIIEEQ